VLALACVVIGACFGVGYLAALAKRERLETTNIVASFAAVAVLFAVLTPIADPVRISVSSQVARLMEGRISAEAFDYKYLRFEGGRYGLAALARMQAGEFKIAGVPERAKQAAALAGRYSVEPLDRNGVALNITMAPGRALPESFLKQDWAALTRDRNDYPWCFRQQSEPCEAFLLDIDGDGADEILLVGDALGYPPTVLRYDGNRWIRAGELSKRMACDDLRPLLRSGQFRTLPSRWNDIEIGGLRLDIAEKSESDVALCPGE
jgi:hypothetical protein